MSFRPLIRGFFFYVLKCVQHYSEENKAFPSPYSGILFLSGCIPKKPKWAKYVSVPSFGDSFFIPRRRSSLQLSAVRVSVPSFGDSFFISNHQLYTGERYQKGFRPLIRGFFFYEFVFTALDGAVVIVSVPSFGDSFFMHGKSYKAQYFKKRFRPLIRGFFFYLPNWLSKHPEMWERFRPLIRGFFFYKPEWKRIYILCVCFRPLIRGFFFYDGKSDMLCCPYCGVSVPSFGDSFFMNDRLLTI